MLVKTVLMAQTLEKTEFQLSTQHSALCNQWMTTNKVLYIFDKHLPHEPVNNSGFHANLDFFDITIATI